MPAVAVIAHVLPIAVIVKIVHARNLIRDVVVTGVMGRRIVIVGIVEIGVVVSISSVISFRIPIAIVAVEIAACLVVINARDRAAVRRRSAAWDRQYFTFI